MSRHSVVRLLIGTVILTGCICAAQAAPPRSYRRVYDNYHSPHHPTYAERYGLYQNRTYAQRYGLYRNGSYAQRYGLYSNLTYAQRYGFSPYGSYAQRNGLYSYGYAPFRQPYLGVHWMWPYHGIPGYRFATRGFFAPGFGCYGCYGYRGYRW